MTEIERFELSNRLPPLLIDDIIATGGSMAAAVELCEKVGYRVEAMACLVDLTFLNSFKWGNMSVRSLVQYQQ